MRRLIALLLLLACTSTPSRPAAAQGFIIPELGARKNGMGAAVGRPDDVTAIYHNPGALALLKGTRVSISASAAFIDINLRLAQWKVNASDTEPFLTDPADADGYHERQSQGIAAPIPFLGVSTSLFTDKLVAALGVYVPNAAGADFGAKTPTRYHAIDAFVISAFFTAAVAYRPLPWLAVGVGGSAVYIRIQRRSLLYPVLPPATPGGKNLDVSPILGTETELEIVGDDLKPAFSLGIQAWPHKTLSLGFMMLTRYDVSLEGPLTLKPGSDASSIIRNDPAYYDNQHRTEIVSPWIFAFGANWDITSWLEVGAELRYYLNSQVVDQVTTITSGKLGEVVTDGFVTEKNLNDTIHIGGGFRVAPPLPLDLELMTGFHYEPSPSPDNTVEISAPSFDIFALHWGARWRFASRYSLALIYSHYEYFERTTIDSITNPPTNFVGSGYNNQVSLVFEVQVADGIAVRK